MATHMFKLGMHIPHTKLLMSTNLRVIIKGQGHCDLQYEIKA